MSATPVSCACIKAIDCATNLPVGANETLPHYSEGGRYSCKYCNKSVNIRHGRIKSPHFYHLHTGSCLANIGDTRDDTHLKLQETVCELLSLPPEAMEVRIGTCIADIVWRKEDHGLDLPDIVIEIQRSPISVGEMEHREKNYKEHGYMVIWIFQAPPPESPYLPGAYFKVYDRRMRIYKLSQVEATLPKPTLYLTGKDTYFLFAASFVCMPHRKTLFYCTDSTEIHDKQQLSNA